MKNLTRHHLKNKCRGGSNLQSNLILLTVAHHRSWHCLFKDLDLDEIIKLLTHIRDNKRLAKRFWRSLKDLEKEVVC